MDCTKFIHKDGVQFLHAKVECAQYAKTCDADVAIALCVHNDHFILYHTVTYLSTI